MAMKHQYLDVTFRNGKAIAAYLSLPREAGTKVARTTDEGMGLRADFDAHDKLIGIEITAPHAVDADQVNAVLARLGEKPLRPEDWAPLRAA